MTQHNNIAVLCVYKHLASFVRSSFTLLKTQDWVETSVFFDNNSCVYPCTLKTQC